jgi:mannose-6-phosphate isomerase-like protein (cupin superfamily)
MMGLMTGKVWGTTELLLQTPFIEIHKLVIEPRRRCSLHHHEHKWNAFYVSAGRLTIEVHKSTYDLIDRTELGPGQFTTVRPKELHRFISGETRVEAIEIYYPEALSEDIVRKDVGGIAGEWAHG